MNFTLDPSKKRAEVGYRLRAAPQAKCRNCSFFLYDSQYAHINGHLKDFKVNKRCVLHGLKVTLNATCNSHLFLRPDRSDK